MQPAKRLLDARAAVLADARFDVVWERLAHLPNEVFIVGGALRCQLLGDRPAPRDLDLLVEDGVDRVLEAVGESGVLTSERVGFARLILPNAACVDVFSPGSFRPQCQTVPDVLRLFDLSVNAVAVSLRGSTVHDPLGGAADALTRRVTLTEERWIHADCRDAVHLLMRLAELAVRQPLLTVSNPALLKDRLSAVAATSDWEPVWRCHGMTREEALSILGRLSGDVAEGKGDRELRQTAKFRQA